MERAAGVETHSHALRHENGSAGLGIARGVADADARPEDSEPAKFDAPFVIQSRLNLCKYSLDGAFDLGFSQARKLGGQLVDQF